MPDQTKKRGLPQVAPRAEGLGRATIMDRGLASRHGAPYVHLAVLAIDVDRVRDARDDEELPFAWEVFLTEAYLLESIDPVAAHALVEDVVLGVIDQSAEAADEGVLGSQIAFAVWDAIARGVWPVELRKAFSAWKARPKDLVKALAVLWADEARAKRELADLCLATELEPPLAPPTIEILRRWASVDPPVGG